MAPEVLSSGMVSKAADVYAFGVLMWEMYMGQRAWEGSTPPQVMLAVCLKKEMLEFPDNAPPVRVGFPYTPTMLRSQLVHSSLVRAMCLSVFCLKKQELHFCMICQMIGCVPKCLPTP